MQILAALAALAAVAVAAWLYLALAHGWYWRTDQGLPCPHGDPARWPDVTAIVPARDEAAMLPQTLPGLLALVYVAMTLDSARRHRAGHGGPWKGRPPPSTNTGRRESADR